MNFGNKYVILFHNIILGGGMATNINCAALNYDCVFSITASDNEQDLMIRSVEQHAKAMHPELIAEENLKPEVKEKLKNLILQSHYSDQSYLSK